jgi:hypothetical protein
MSAEYTIIWRSSSGVRRSVIALAGPGDGIIGRNYAIRLAYRKEVNAPGWFRVDVPGDHPDLPLYTDKDQVQILRRPPGGSFAPDFEGVFRDEAVADDEYGQDLTSLSGPGAMGRLGWYHVFYPADTVNQTVFTSVPAETVLKRLVRFNATSEATAANGRIRTAPNYAISVAADGATGNVLSVRPGAYRNLLQAIQRTQPISGLDFDLIRTAPNAWEFRTYLGQRGTDRRASLVFSRELGTMRDVRYAVERSAERTVAVVGGQGEGADREVVVRTTGPNFSAANDIETFLEATDVEFGATALLNARGDAALDGVAARPTFEFAIVPTESVRYGVDFQVGDLCRARHPRIGVIDVQIMAVSIEYEAAGESRERIAVEVRRL